jgi:hypothetical protein
MVQCFHCFETVNKIIFFFALIFISPCSLCLCGEKFLGEDRTDDFLDPSL